MILPCVNKMLVYALYKAFHSKMNVTITQDW